MVTTGGLVNKTRNLENCFEAGFMVSDFNSELSNRLVPENPTSNPTFAFLSITPIAIDRDDIYMIEFYIFLTFDYRWPISPSCDCNKR